MSDCGLVLGVLGPPTEWGSGGVLGPLRGLSGGVLGPLWGVGDLDTLGLTEEGVRGPLERGGVLGPLVRGGVLGPFEWGGVLGPFDKGGVLGPTFPCLGGVLGPVGVTEDSEGGVLGPTTGLDFILGLVWGGGTLKRWSMPLMISIKFVCWNHNSHWLKKKDERLFITCLSTYAWNVPAFETIYSITK